MTSSRKKPGLAFWATVVVVVGVVLFVLYAVSGLVVCELGQRGILADRSLEHSAFYRPLGWLLYQLIGSGG